MTRSISSLLFALIVSARADTLTLRNGTSVNGSWVGIEAGQIKFLANNQVLGYSRSDVSNVTFGVAATPQPSAPIEPVVPPRSVSRPLSASGTSPDPEIIGAVYFRDEAGMLIPLERTVARVLPRSGGLRPQAQYWEMERATSPVRLKGGQRMLFVARLANGVDPATIGLYPLDVRKDARRTRADPRNKAEALALRLTVTRVGQFSYGFSSEGDLATGEYGFSSKNSNDTYCFGLDSTAAR